MGAMSGNRGREREMSDRQTEGGFGYSQTQGVITDPTFNWLPCKIHNVPNVPNPSMSRYICRAYIQLLTVAVSTSMGLI